MASGAADWVSAVEAMAAMAAGWDSVAEAGGDSVAEAGWDSAAEAGWDSAAEAAASCARC